MSTTIKQVSPEVFNRERNFAINNQLIRKEVSLSEFNVFNDEAIEIDGVLITMTPKAFKQLLGRLRIPTAFANRFSNSFGTDGLKQLIQMMKSAKSAFNDQRVTLLVNPKTRNIVDILPAGYASISNEGFFDFTEEYINKYGLIPTHVGSDPNGGSIINCLTNSTEFAVRDMANEVFRTGVTFRNSPTEGLQVTPYLNRLICTNGITSTSFEETFSLSNLNSKSIEEFNNHMLQMASTGFQPVGFINSLKKANETSASLAEMQASFNKMVAVSPNADYANLQKYIPINRAMSAYENIGAHPEEFTKAQMKNAKAGISVWDLIGGITNFASNDKFSNLKDSDRADLMVYAGNLLTKSQYDTESVLDFNPFAKTGLLTETETLRMRGE